MEICHVCKGGAPKQPKRMQEILFEKYERVLMSQVKQAVIVWYDEVISWNQPAVPLKGG